MNETNNSAAPTATAETPATADPASAPSGNLQDWIIEWSIIGAILLLILFVAKKKGWLDRIRIFFLQTREYQIEEDTDPHDTYLSDLFQSCQIHTSHPFGISMYKI